MNSKKIDVFLHREKNNNSKILQVIEKFTKYTEIHTIFIPCFSPLFFLSSEYASKHFILTENAAEKQFKETERFHVKSLC